MEENKVATDSGLRSRAEKVAKWLTKARTLSDEVACAEEITTEAIFRELVAVRDLAQAELRGLAGYGRAHLDNLKPPFVKESK